jgi:hypothetical protein
MLLAWNTQHFNCTVEAWCLTKITHGHKIQVTSPSSWVGWFGSPLVTCGTSTQLYQAYFTSIILLMDFPFWSPLWWFQAIGLLLDFCSVSVLLVFTQCVFLAWNFYPYQTWSLVLGIGHCHLLHLRTNSPRGLVNLDIGFSGVDSLLDKFW